MGAKGVSREDKAKSKAAKEAAKSKPRVTVSRTEANRAKRLERDATAKREAEQKRLGAQLEINKRELLRSQWQKVARKVSGERGWTPSFKDWLAERELTPC